MKRPSWMLILISVALFQSAKAQMLLHFDTPTSIDSLEIIHKSAIHVDPLQAVFEDQEAWVKAYREWHNALSKQLKEGGLELHEKLELYMRVYFRPDGHVSHISYQMQSAILDEKQSELFKQLLEAYGRGHPIKKSADIPFKQCGRVTIQANMASGF